MSLHGEHYTACMKRFRASNTEIIFDRRKIFTDHKCNPSEQMMPTLNMCVWLLLIH